MLPILLLQLFMLICSPLLAMADVRDELKGVNSQIREKQQLIKQTKKVESKISSELTRIERSLKEKESSLTSLHKEMKVVESGISATQKQIQLTVAELDKKKAQISRRITSLYKAGEMGSVRIFFSSGTLPQALENQRYMQSVLEQDRKLFNEYQSKLQQLQGLKDSLEREAAKKEKLTAKIQSKKQEIESEKSKKAAYLTQVRQEKKGYQASLKELQENARRLQSMVEKLEARSRKSYSHKDEKKPVPGEHYQPPLTDRGFGAQRGRLSLPVAGEIKSRFGKHKHAEFNSFTFNNGITFSAAMNADIKSVFDGEVIFAEKFKGYGNMLIIDHGGGYFTLYANASKIVKKVGASVRRNEVVAHVGDSDAANGPQLYFEIRYQGKPVDPGPWLK